MPVKPRYFTVVDSMDYPATHAVAKQYGCSCTLLREVGPAGGNPEVKVTSLSRFALKNFLKAEGYDLELHKIESRP